MCVQAWHKAGVSGAAVVQHYPLQSVQGAFLAVFMGTLKALHSCFLQPVHPLKYRWRREREVVLLLFWECDIRATRCILIIFHGRSLDTLSLGSNFLNVELHWKNGQQNPRMGLLCVRYNVNKVRLFLPQQACRLKDKIRLRKIIFQGLSRLLSGWTVSWMVPQNTEFVSSPSDLKTILTSLKFPGRMKSLLWYLCCRQENTSISL